MAQFLFYGATVLLMPYLTVLLVHHGVGGLASFVGFGAALACLMLATLLAQTTSILVALMRFLRKLVGGKDVDAPPTLAEKALLVSGPMAVSLFIYGATGAVLAFWAQMDAIIFIGLMLVLGVIYGCLMSYGLLRQLTDIHDVGPL